jgi:hypothetical protein
MIRFELRNGREAALMAFRRLTPRQREAVMASLERRRDDGRQPLEDCLTELGVDSGDPPALARQNARRAIEEPSDDFRAVLN